MKYKVFGKKQVFWMIMALIWLAVIVTVVALTATKAVNAEPRRVPVYCVDTEEKKIALTFNAAWGDETTEAVLETLERYGVKATFFFVGAFAEKYPESVKKIANAGHEVANHSMRHKDPTKQEYAELLSDISACSELLASLTGLSPCLYRAPAGAYDKKTVEAAESLGMTAVQWSADSIDWKNPSPDTIVQRILKKAAPGGIVLLHLGKENTVKALPDLIGSLTEEGYTFVTVSQLFPAGETSVDKNGVMRGAR